MKSITIFHFEGSSREDWLEVYDDATVSYMTALSGWAAVKHPSEEPVIERLSLTDAKKRWPLYADEIDRALAKLRRR